MNKLKLLDKMIRQKLTQTLFNRVAIFIIAPLIKNQP